jgi:glucose dehydrogenase
MNASIIGSIVRWLLTIGASKQFFTETDAAQITDAVVLLGTLAWSVWEKSRRTP